MQIADKRSRPRFEKPFKMRGAFLVTGQHGGIFQISDVLAHKGLVAARQAQGRLELAAAPQDGRRDAIPEKDGTGHIAARAAVEKRRGPARGSPSLLRGMGHDTGDAVIHAHENIPIMQQPCVRYARKTLQRLAIAKTQGLASRIGRCHDEKGRRAAVHAGQLPEQREMQRRIRKHESQRVHIGRHIGGHPDGGARRTAGTQHYGLFRRQQQGLVLRRQCAATAHVVQRGRHQGKGLVRPVFALTQTRHSPGVTGEARQLKSPKALERQHPPPAQGAGGPFQRLPFAFRRARRALRARRAFPFHGGIHEPDMRPAPGAGHRLRMETPVAGIRIFGGTGGTQRETGHAGRRPVVGDGAGDGVARAAIGTIDKGIGIAEILRIGHLAGTVVTDANIGAYQNAVPRMAATRKNTEIRTAAFRRRLFPGELRHTRQRRQLTAQA